MTTYAIYDSTSNNVKWFTEAQHDPAGLPSGLAFIVVPDNTDRAKKWTVGGNPLALSAYVPTFAENQAAKTGAAIANFNGLFTAPKGFTIQGALMQIDASSQANIGGAVSAAMLSVQDSTDYPWDSGFYWVAADNSHVAMTAAEMVSFGHAVFEYVRLTRIQCRGIKDAIAAATTQAALDAIDVTAGYPAASA